MMFVLDVTDVARIAVAKEELQGILNSKGEIMYLKIYRPDSVHLVDTITNSVHVCSICANSAKYNQTLNTSGVGIKELGYIPAELVLNTPVGENSS